MLLSWEIDLPVKYGNRFQFNAVAIIDKKPRKNSHIFILFYFFQTLAHIYLNCHGMPFFVSRFQIFVAYLNLGWMSVMQQYIVLEGVKGAYKH